jgi:hypothetical protein
VENPGALTSGGSVVRGEAHGGATPRVTLQAGTRAIHRTARPGCRAVGETHAVHAASVDVMADRLAVSQRPSAAHRPRDGFAERREREETPTDRIPFAHGSWRAMLGAVVSAMQPSIADRAAGSYAASAYSRANAGRWHRHSMLSEAASPRW